MPTDVLVEMDEQRRRMRHVPPAIEDPHMDLLVEAGRAPTVAEDGVTGYVRE
jgi:hypothetical protein